MNDGQPATLHGGTVAAVAMAVILNVWSLVACATARCPDPYENKAGILVSIYLGSNLLSYARHLYENGQILYREAGGDLRCTYVSQSEVSRIQELLISTDVQRALDRVKDEEDRYADWFLVTIDEGEGPIGIPAERVPRDLVPFLTVMDEIWSNAFGRRYDRSLVESLP